MDKKLFEGVKFGDREKALVMKHVNDYNVGIEYEMHFYKQLNISELAYSGFETLLNALDNHDMDHVMDQLYSDAIDRHEEFNFFDDTNATTLYNVMQSIVEIDKTIKENFPSDQDKDDAEEFGSTDDMFGDKDNPENIARYFKSFFTDEQYKQYEEFFKNADNNGITEWSDYLEIMDLYYEGEMFSNPSSAKLFGDYVKILSSMFMSSEVQLAKIFNSLVDSMANVELHTVASIDDLNYTPGAFKSNNLPLSDYVNFRDDHYVIKYLEDLVEEYAIENGDEALESRSDEYAIPEESDLEREGVDLQFIDTITTEGQEQAEIITTKMNVADAFKNIDQMFEFISHTGETTDVAGMHISISTNKYNLDDFKLMKFVTLLDLGHVLDLFPERGYVENLEDIIHSEIANSFSEAFEDSYHGNARTLKPNDIIKSLLFLVKDEIEDDKYQSIKFGDYKILDGRIELRFFGGEDYHHMEDDIKHHLLRALFLLNFAYTDEYNKEFYKKFTKMVSHVCRKEYGAGLGELVSKVNAIERLFKSTPHDMYSRYLNARGSYMAEDLEAFDRYMTKSFGKNWAYKMQFLMELE